MLLALLVYVIPYVLSIVVLIAVLNAVINLRRSKRAPYFRIRQDASIAGWRWIGVTLLALIGIGLGLYARRAVDPPMLSRLLNPGVEATPTFEVLLIETDEMATSDITGTDGMSELPPTITPAQPTAIRPTPPPIATIESPVTPSADAAVLITDISSDISATLKPVNPGQIFPAGIQRIYFFFEFSSLADGVSWSRVLLRNGEIVRSESEEWARGTSGEAYHWFSAQGGWPAGEYEIQLYVGTRLVDSRTFTIIN